MLSTHDACRLLAEIVVERESDRIALRARLVAVAQRLGFSPLEREDMILVCYELASNIYKHANGRGAVQIWLQPGGTLDLFAFDHGPGVAQLEAAFSDGYSTSKTLGKGLGSVVRLSHDAVFYTRTAGSEHSCGWHGTAVMARFSRQAPLTGVGLYSRSLRDDRYNGDRIFLYTSSEVVRWLHTDGLGSGEQAQAATAPLGRALFRSARPSEILQSAAELIGSGHGAVAAAGALRCGEQQLDVVGVGDVYLQVLETTQTGVTRQQLGFAPGVLGRGGYQERAHRVALGERSVVLSASDGIRQNWRVESYPRLLHLDPQFVAYFLGCQVGRLSDDQSLLVLSTARLMRRRTGEGGGRAAVQSVGGNA